MANIQWFPGHMARARREITENLSLVDLVIEMVDARIPESSRNPLLDDIIQQKKRLIVLNKEDLAIPSKLNAWVNYFQEQDTPAVPYNALQNKGLNQVQKAIKEMMAEEMERWQTRGLKARPIRLMIIGIPNIGKSTLINRFVGKNQAITGHHPGVTRKQRWLKVGSDFELLDTPGVLWPKFEDPETAKKLAITGAVKDSLLHMDDLALYVLEYLKAYNPDILVNKYHVSNEDIQSLTTVDLLLLITEKMNLKDNYEEASERIIRALRQGELGRIMLDSIPGDDECETANH